MADLPGPKMRIGKLEQEPVELDGDIHPHHGNITGNRSRASVIFPRLPGGGEAGDTLFLNDGLIQLEVLESAAQR